MTVPERGDCDSHSESFDKTYAPDLLYGSNQSSKLNSNQQINDTEEQLVRLRVLPMHEPTKHTQIKHSIMPIIAQDCTQTCSNDTEVPVICDVRSREDCTEILRIAEKTTENSRIKIPRSSTRVSGLRIQSPKKVTKRNTFCWPLLIFGMLSTFLVQAKEITLECCQVEKKANVTCHFEDDMSKLMQPIYLIQQLNTISAKDLVIVVTIKWDKGEPKIYALQDYKVVNGISTILTVEITDLNNKNAGQYWCDAFQYNMEAIHPCEITIKANEDSISEEGIVTHYYLAIILPLIIIINYIIIIIIILRKRRLKQSADQILLEEYQINLETASPLINDNQDPND